MGERTRRLSKALALVAAGAVLGSALFAVAAKKPSKPAKRDPDPAHSIRDTGVGLPRIHSEGTLAIGEFVPSVRNYHDSGSYASDLQSVGSQALAFMQRQAKAVRKAGKCPKKKKKKCKPAPQLAITLDIDETSLSNYTELEAGNFANATGALAVAITTADSPAIAPTLAMYQRARQMNISVFFITGRQPGLEALTRQNLTFAGYTDVAGLYMKPPADETIPFKSASRAAIEQQGFRVIANVGDQESDLTGGGADRSYKLPNPYYFIE